MSQSRPPRPSASFRELGVFLVALAVVLSAVALFRHGNAPAVASAPQAQTQAQVQTPAKAAVVTAPAAPAPAAPAALPATTAQAGASTATVAIAAPVVAPAAVPAAPPATPASAPAATTPAPSAPASPAAASPSTRQAAAPPASNTEVRAAPQQARTSMKIQQVKSASGIEAWLVEEHSVPLMALRFAFEGGSSQDPAGKEGVANFVASTLDEGAGDLDHTLFQERMEELALKMSFEDARDAFYGSFETLSINRDAALDMLRLAVTKPRFDQESIDRVRQQLLAGLSFAAKSPDKVAAKAWSAAAYPNHPYGKPADGTLASVAAITRDDLESYRRRVFGRDTLRVVAVGDVTAADLAKILDHVFGDLPAKAELVAVPKVAPQPAEKLKIVEMDVPQSVVQFGMNGFARKDPDFIPAFVMNQILGGGGFASRLTEEVREKRGLAYSVYSYLQPYRHAAMFLGGVATKNEEVGRSLDVIRSELKRMADEGPTPAELANAKSYLTGSFALRFDTNAKIANQLLWMLQEDMGIDYVEKRNALIDAVSMEDVKRAAKRLLVVDDLIVTVVGKPQGIGQKS